MATFAAPDMIVWNILRKNGGRDTEVFSPTLFFFLLEKTHTHV